MHKFITFLQIQIIMLLLWLVDFKLQIKEFFKQWWVNIVKDKNVFLWITTCMVVLQLLSIIGWTCNQLYFGWCENLTQSFVKNALLNYSFFLIISMSWIILIVGNIPVKVKLLTIPILTPRWLSLFMGLNWVKKVANGLLIGFVIVILIAFLISIGLLIWTYTKSQC